MNYAEKIRDNYFKNKDRIAQHRKELGLSYILRLEDALKDGYTAYKSFCQEIGVKPKKIIDFLRTEVI